MKLLIRRGHAIPVGAVVANENVVVLAHGTFKRALSWPSGSSSSNPLLHRPVDFPTRTLPGEAQIVVRL